MLTQIPDAYNHISTANFAISRVFWGIYFLRIRSVGLTFFATVVKICAFKVFKEAGENAPGCLS